jgi:hypothetical protein
MGLCPCYTAGMRERIRKRLKDYRADALQSIGVTVNRTRSKAAGYGNLNSSRLSLTINDDTKAGFTEYMDQSIKFIRHVAPGSSAEYVDELWDGGHKLKQEIMANTKSELRAQLSEALDKLIERKVENFELGYIEGQEMNATTQNTVNIIGSNISNSVVQITQSGKDSISKETALKLQELVNSEEIKALPEETQSHVLDQVSDLLKELEASTTDKGKVHRGLKRLGDFLSQVASSSIAETIAQAAIAYGTFYGMLPT